MVRIMDNLEQEQLQMRQRQPARPGPRPGHRERAKAGSVDEFRRFISAHTLLEKGWSVSRVAAHLCIDYSRLKRWDDEHRPLCFDY
jgi:hypothetical protein